MLGENATKADELDGVEDTVAQMRQLAVHDPEAARRLAADLMAALDRAGVRFEPGKQPPSP